jgi:hypothetical protein
MEKVTLTKMYEVLAQKIGRNGDVKDNIISLQKWMLNALFIILVIMILGLYAVIY